MAEKGTFSAYQRLQPLEADFVTPINKVVDEQRRIIEKEEELRKERTARKEKLAKDFATDYSTLTDVVTNNKTIDEAFARGIGSARDMMGDLYRDIQSNPNLSSHVPTQIKLQNLKNYAKNLKIVSGRYTEYAKTVASGIQDGSLSDWNSEALSDMDSIFAQMNIDVNVDADTGMPKAVIAKVDSDGNKVLDEDGQVVMKELNLIEVLDGRGLTGLVQRYDFLKGVKDLGSAVGDRLIEESGSNFQTIEYQKFEDIEDEVRSLVKGQIGSPARPSSVAKSVWADAMGREPKELTESDIKEIEDYFTESIGTFYNEKNKNSIDYRARTAASKEARERAEAAKEEGSGLEIITDTNEKPELVTHSQVGTDVGGSAYGFTLKEPTKIKPKGDEITVNRIYYNEKENKIFYDGSVFVGQTSKKIYDEDDVEVGRQTEKIFKKKIGGRAEDIDILVRALPGDIKNLGELKRELLRLKNEKVKQTSGGGVKTSSGNKYE